MIRLGRCAMLAALFTALALFLERETIAAILRSGAAVAFADPDDAMRLAQVRAFLDGGGWFDVVIPTAGDGAGMRSHWSRLIDLPIAAIIAAASPFTGQAGAELTALLVWPKLVLVAFLTLLLRQSAREGGWTAAFAMLALFWLSFHALSQFQLTRIDHHNAQNALATLALMMATAPAATLGSALIAGIAGGLGLAIGYEALVFAGLAAALLALAAAAQPERQGLAEGFAGGLALSVSLLFLLTTAPGKWLAIPCDALGLNLVAGVLIGALGVFAAGMFVGARARIATLTAFGAAAALLFWRLEPACIAGPFGKTDPAIGPIWLDHVEEARSLLSYAAAEPGVAGATAISLIACLLLQLLAAQRSRAAPDLIRLILLTAMTMIAFLHMKMIPYAQLFGFYCAALTLARLPAIHAQVSPRVGLLAGVLLLTPLLPMAAIEHVAPTAAASAAPTAGPAASCWRESHLDRLAALPPSRILAQPDLGSVAALLAKHRSLVANYHRLDAEAVRAFAIFQAPVAAAQPMLKDWSVDVIAHCPGRRFYRAASPPGSLADALERGEPPTYLAPIDVGSASPVRAWRVITD